MWVIFSHLQHHLHHSVISHSEAIIFNLTFEVVCCFFTRMQNDCKCIFYCASCFSFSLICSPPSFLWSCVCCWFNLFTQMFNFRCEPEKQKTAIADRNPSYPGCIIYFWGFEYNVKLVSNPGSEVEFIIWQRPENLIQPATSLQSVQHKVSDAHHRMP